VNAVAPTTFPQQRLERILDLVSQEALQVPVVVAFASTLLVTLPLQISGDGWLALLSGHEIVAHGLPAHDSLTIWSNGHRWTDQQWLAQLGLYGLYALGGLRLALLVHGSLIVTAFVAAVTLARVRGNSIRSVIWISLPVAFTLACSTSVLRPQSIAYVLFVVLLWLLTNDSRRPSRKVLLVAPVLIAWANLHGTVVLGSLLVVLYAASAAWSRRRVTTREASLVACALALPFASPYAMQLPAYYRSVLFNPAFAQYVAEWRPTTPSLLTYPFYGLAFLTFFLLGRQPRALTLFERATLVVLAGLALHAMRGIAWFCLASLVLLPTLLDRILVERPEIGRRSTRLALAAVAMAMLAAVAVAIATKPSSWFASRYPDSVAARVAAAAGPDGKVFANERFADWLLLREPSLRGRVAYDVRLELLSDRQLVEAASVVGAQGEWQRVLAPYDVVVLLDLEKLARDELLRTTTWRQVYASAGVVVIRRR
jgi:hypothetical protein